MKTTQTKLPKSQIEIEFELTEEEFKHHIEHALGHFKKHVKVDGFRPGHAPLKMVEEKVKPESLLMEAGDCAVKEVYSQYILENKLEPIGQPDVSIVKIAQGSPFIFKATITLLPEVELPEYKGIASKIKGKDVAVTEEEVQDALNYLQRTRAKFIAEDRPAAKKDFVEIEYSAKDINEGKPVNDRFILGEAGFMKGFQENIEGMKAGEEKEFKVAFPEDSIKKDLAGKEMDFKVKVKSVQKVELPEINDEFAKELGAFDTLVALKESMKEGMTQEKKEAEKQKRRGEILDKIAEKIKVDIPDALINYEEDRLMEDLKQRVSQGMKITFEQYLASVKQTEEGIKATFQKEAEKRIKGFLILREVGKKESIEVQEKEVDEEVEKSIKNYSKEQLSKIDIEQLKEYTKGVIYNEKVFEKLENLPL